MDAGRRANTGNGRGRRKAVRDELLRVRTIVNVVKDENGNFVALDYCPERRPASLDLGDDPTVRHLNPESGADGAQTALDGDEGASAQLRRAPRPYKGRTA